MYSRFFAQRAAHLADSSLKAVLETSPGIISFAGGLPDERAFEYDAIQQIMDRVAREPSAWQYAPTEGDEELRELIADSMKELGVDATGDNVIVTGGSQQALDLLNMLLVDPEDSVLIEAPGYIGAIKAAENYQARIVPLPLEQDGVSTKALEAWSGRAKYLYTVSTFQNPAGYTLSLAKRRELLRLAKERDFLIIEDGAYQRLRFEGEEIPTIKSLDVEDRVVYTGSFSKVLVPGIRVGWIVAHPEIIQKLALIKQGADLAGNSVGQRFALHWMREFGLRPPVPLYREKRDCALTALQRYMPAGVHWNHTEGGFFLWLTLPSSLDAKDLLEVAKSYGVSFVPGYAFGGDRSSLRFSFSQVPLKEIEPGAQRLAQSIRSVLERSA